MRSLLGSSTPTFFLQAKVNNNLNNLHQRFIIFFLKAWAKRQVQRMASAMHHNCGLPANLALFMFKGGGLIKMMV
ncbi:hypothetical protein [Undibacterium umbellatum]|uniref:Uncharacterized protein n=1 Tax=Undibacterium umbellatum TaxID=2762300 RepID=A0ABR6ZC81_9BURK|nr:hypothetical protein [Undibacterium umbellatum]MBC3909363.1 hypothetical protein [Undibacterium umbellatum]